jgi:hypothetical protein
MVPKIYQNILNDNVNKKPKIQPNYVFWKIWNLLT